MKHTTLADFQKAFPNEEACLEYIFKLKHPRLKGYYRVRKRKCFANSKGKQIYPLKDTIFARSKTPLMKWFFVIYLFSVSKNGVSGAEIRRHLGVTEKCAWRMGYQIRKLMKQQRFTLKGTVEVDETLYGGRRRKEEMMSNKTQILGMVERGGRIKAKVIPGRENHILLGNIKRNISRKATVYTDNFVVYKKVPKLGYKHRSVNHSKYEWARGPVHTAHIEGFWSYFKNSVRGTYRSVSPKHLQTYLDLYAFSYNHRFVCPFQELLKRL